MNEIVTNILETFRSENLHTDLSPEEQATLATELAELEIQGHVVDLRTCRVTGVKPEQPIPYVPAEVQP